jgi:hypothetical protein
MNVIVVMEVLVVVANATVVTADMKKNNANISIL